jgi:YidC/Oxa1 family membrane protein insertase
MNILYTIFILPLETLMKLILEFSYALTDNYGISIIVLSVIVNILLLPLYYMAERWKAADQEQRDLMKPEIDNIKKYYKGQERHFYIQTIYRRFGYHPLSSVKASVGFLIQIPFFFAAFHLLSNYTALNGVSFGVLSDLGSADGLLGGIHLLPILMTVINLLSAYVYMELLSKTEKMQLFGLAFIFLVVLYTEASGLLLYWTMNNLFSLVKNLVEKKLKLGPLFSKTFKVKKERRTFPLKLYISKIYKKIEVPVWFLGLVFLIGIDRIYLYNLDKKSIDSGLFIIEAIVVFTYLVFTLLLNYFASDEKKTIAFKVLVSFLSLVYFVFLLDLITGMFKFTEVNHLKENIIGVGILLFLFLSLAKVLSKSKTLNSFQPTFKIYGLIYFSLFTLLFVVNPTTLYNSSVDDFLIGSDLFLSKSFTILVGLLALFSGLYFISSKVFRNFLIFFGSFLLISSLLYSFVTVKDYGLMDHFIFNVPENLFVTQAQMSFEILGLLLLVGVTVYVVNNYKDLFEKALVVVAVMLVSFFVLNLPSKQESVVDKKALDLTEERKTTLALSKERNVLVFFLDGFPAGELNKIYSEKKEILDEYDGFTWYKNTLTTGTGTQASMAALVGGHNYTVEAINNRANKLVREEIQEAYRVFPKAFIPNRWDVTYFNPQYGTDIDKKVNNTQFDYRTYYLNKHGQKGLEKLKTDNELKMLFAISIFRMSPLFMKDVIYADGKWGGVYKSVQKKIDAMYYKGKYWGFLSTFEESMNFTSQKKTLKYIQLAIPHKPNLIAPNGKLSFGETSFYIESYMSLKKIGEILKKLKSNGVYDNTKVIVVSDHGWPRPNSSFKDSFVSKVPRGYERRMSGGMVNPLLLMKDFGSKGEFKISDRFMSNADVPSIVCSSLKKGCGIKDIDPTKKRLDRELQVSTVKVNFDSEKSFRIKEAYKVKENIFDPNNWERIK